MRRIEVLLLLRVRLGMRRIEVLLLLRVEVEDEAHRGPPSP